MKTIEEFRQHTVALALAPGTEEQFDQQAKLFDRMREFCLRSKPGEVLFAQLHSSPETIRLLTQLWNEDFGDETMAIVQEVSTGLNKLAQYCRLRATALRLREQGKTTGYQRLCEQAKSVHLELPAGWSW